MFKSIPTNRLFLYSMIAGIIPLLLAWLWVSSGLDSVKTTETRLWMLQDQAFTREQKQSVNLSTRARYSDVDHFYIDKNLETLTFLSPEVESLKKIKSNPNFPDDEKINKRLEQLTGSANRLSFTEGVVQSTPLFQEVTETLVHPVEVNAKDIQEILCRVEGVSIGDCVPKADRPQMIILDFKLEKKNVNDKNQVYQLNLKILKREFT